MVTKDFSEFVARQQVDETDEKVDWAEIRDEWLKNLDSLYKKIAEFLEEYLVSKSITLGFTDIRLAEENVGEYAAKRMDIKIGRQRVTLEPVGTLLIGSKGRVDVRGSAGKGLLLLLNEKAKKPADLISLTVIVGKTAPPPKPQKGPISWVWKIVGAGPQRDFLDLNRDSFLALLMEVTGA